MAAEHRAALAGIGCSLSQLSITMYWHIRPRPITMRKAIQAGSQGSRPWPGPRR